MAMPHGDDAIRSIAKKLVGEAVSDYQITKTANAAGCDCPVTTKLSELDMMQRFILLKYMIGQGKARGYTIEELAKE